MRRLFFLAACLRLAACAGDAKPADLGDASLPGDQDRSTHAPVVAVAWGTTALEGSSYGYPIVCLDLDGDRLTIARGLNDSCAGTVSDSVNGVPDTATYWFEPTESQGGTTCVLDVRCSDGTHEAVAQTAIEILEVNDAPALTNLPSTVRAPFDSPATFVVGVSDSDLPAQDLSLTIDITDCSFAPELGPQGELTWTCSGTETCRVALVVTDDGWPPAAARGILTIECRNQEPAFTSSAPGTATEHELLLYLVACADPDGDRLTLARGANDSCLGELDDHGDGTGTYALVPGELQGGTSCLLEVSCSDGGTLITQSASLVIQEANEPPQLLGLPASLSLHWSRPGRLPISGEDLDLPAQQVTLSVASTSCGAQVAVDGGELVVECGGIESCTITLQAQDDQQPPGVDQATLAIVCTNTAPILTADDPPGQLRKGLVNRIGAACRDPDGDAVSAWVTDQDSCGGTLTTRPAGLLSYDIDPQSLATGSSCAVEVACSDSQQTVTAGSPLTVIGPADLQLVVDINQTTFNMAPANFLNLAGTVFFTADDGYRGTELWKIESPYTQMVFVKDLVPGPDSSHPRYLNDWGGFLVFATRGPGNVDTIWQSDGTALATTVLHTVSDSSCGLITVAGTLYICSYSSASGYALWNGNSGELTTPLTTSTAAIGNLTGIGSTLFFSKGSELWKSDGTPGNTTLLKTFAGQTLGDFTNVQGELYFSGSTPPAYQHAYLHQSDGTVAGTVTLRDYWSINFPPTRVSKLIAYAGDACYVVSSSTDNLVCVGDSTLLRSASAIYDLFTLAGSLYVAASDGLWRYDGVAWSKPAAQGAFTPVAATPTKQYLTSWHSGGLVFTDLYTVDASGLTLVKSFFNHSTTRAAAVAGELLLFAANDGLNGAELWKSDGSTANTVRIAAMDSGTGDASPSDLVVLDQQLFFAANDGAHGSELWASPGTALGTRLLADLSPPENRYPWLPMGMAAVAGSVYFYVSFWDILGGASLYRASSGGGRVPRRVQR